MYCAEGTYSNQNEWRLDTVEDAPRRALAVWSDRMSFLCYPALCVSAKVRKGEAEQTLLKAVRVASEQGGSATIPHQLSAELYIEMQQPEKEKPDAIRSVAINTAKSLSLFRQTAWILSDAKGAVVARERAVARDESYAAPPFSYGTSSAGNRTVSERRASVHELP